MFHGKNDEGVFLFREEDGVWELRRERATYTRQDLIKSMRPLSDTSNGLANGITEAGSHYERFASVPLRRLRELGSGF